MMALEPDNLLVFPGAPLPPVKRQRLQELLARAAEAAERGDFIPLEERYELARLGALAAVAHGGTG